MMKSDVTNLSQDFSDITKNLNAVNTNSDIQHSNSKIVIGCISLILVGGAVYFLLNDNSQNFVGMHENFTHSFNDLSNLNIESFKNIVKCLKINESKLNFVNDSLSDQLKNISSSITKLMKNQSLDFLNKNSNNDRWT